MGFRIIVEGREDVNFLRQVMEGMGISVNQDDPFLETGGKSMEDFRRLSEVLERNRSKGVKLLAVVDADDDWESRKPELLGFLSEFGIEESHVFTFPDDASDGCLEDLLMQLIPSDEKRKILGCLETASSCVESLGFRGMDKKDRVYQYVSALIPNSQTGNRGKYVNEERRSYREKEIWNLDSEALHPLKHFLQTHLSSF